MEFQIWQSLNDKFDYKKQQYTLDLLLKSEFEFIGSYVDNEGVFKARVIIKDIESLTELNYLLSDDIVIYGSDKDILMAVKTMQNLGLDVRV